MKKLMTIALLATLSLSGCVFQNVKLPGPNNRVATYQLDTDDFKILGFVEAEGEITTILGIVQTGGNGWSALFDKAQDLGADDLMNYSFEVQSYSILTFVYNRATWRARAAAIKYTTQAKP